MIEQEKYENEYQIKEGKKIYPVANNTNKKLTLEDVKNILSIGGLDEDSFSLISLPPQVD